MKSPERPLTRVLMPVLLMTAVLLAGCAPAAPAPAPTATLEPTPTPVPPTATATIVWFPVTPTATSFPTPEVSPTVDMRPRLGEVILTDDFSSAADWNLSSTEDGSASLGNNKLTIAIQQEKTYILSVRRQPVLSNFYLEITATTSLCRGTDEYGLLLRVSPLEDHYRFSISCDGQVRLDRIFNGQISSPVPWTASSAPRGAPAAVRLGVWAYKDELRFFINGEHQFTLHDPLMRTGMIGVFARSSGEDALTVNFSKLEVWEVGD